MYQRSDAVFGQGGGAAALTLGSALPRSHGLVPIDTASGWRQKLADLDPVVDLGVRIGSREWWRGLATCTMLCGVAIATAPGFRPLPGHAPALLPPAIWAETRTIGISPLALGADTGRRMAATTAVEPLVDTPERPTIDLTATIGQGDGFARVLERAGVAEGEAEHVAALISGAVPIDQIKPGTRMDLTLGRRANRSQARPLETLSFRARLDLKLAIERTNGALMLRRIPIRVDETPMRIRGRVGPGLYVSARAAGAPAKAVETFIKAIAARMSIGSDVHANDRFDLIVEHRRAETGEAEVGQLIYAGLDQGRRRTQLLRWTVDGRSQFFEASGVGEQRGGFTMPVVGHQTSGFGMRRHPLLGYSRFHRGVDYGAPYGAPIVAVTAGTVTFAGRHGGHGNYVMLKHGGGLYTAYAHMSRIIARVGEPVAQGQLIGYVGSTGLSTGPHLHYEVWKNGVAVNPLTIRFTTAAQLAGAELGLFRATLARLTAIGTSAAAKPKGE